MMIVSKANRSVRQGRHSVNYQSYQRPQRIFVHYVREKKALGNLGNLSAIKVCTSLF